MRHSIIKLSLSATLLAFFGFFLMGQGISWLVGFRVLEDADTTFTAGMVSFVFGGMMLLVILLVTLSRIVHEPLNRPKKQKIVKPKPKVDQPTKLNPVGPDRQPRVRVDADL